MDPVSPVPQPTPVPETPQPVPGPAIIPPQTSQPMPPAPPVPEPQPMQASMTAGVPAQSHELFEPDIPRGPVGPTNEAGSGYVMPTQYVQNMSFNSVKSPKKKQRMVLLSVVLLLLLIGGVVFGYILPNQPANVYKTGMSRSGKALDKLVTSATEKSTIDQFAKSDVTATLTAHVGESSFTGSLATKYDETGTNGSLVVKATNNGQEKNYSLHFIGQLIKQQTYPAAYVQMNGLKELGLDAFVPGLSAYDGKWISITGEFYKSLGLDKYTSDTNDLTAADVSEMALAATNVTQERVFTADEKVSVFVMKKSLGKEKVDGINAFHYEVGINPTNLAAYCNALVDAVMGTNGYKKFPTYNAATFEEDKKDIKKSCDESGKDIKDSDFFDMWIDAKYKLVYKIRLVEEKDENSYTDFGQKYTGGDDIQFFVHSYTASDKSDAVFNLKTNLKTSQTSADMTLTVSDEKNPYDVKITVTAKPLSGDVDTKAPTDAIKLEDVLKQLGIDPAMFLGGSAATTQTSSPAPAVSVSVSTKANDVAIKTDINGLYSKLEEHYNEFGSYPSLANLASSSWRAANMKNMSLSNKTFTIGGIANSTQYGYSATSCKGSECQHYSLSATTSDGVYTKTSLN